MTIAFIAWADVQQLQGPSTILAFGNAASSLFFCDSKPVSAATEVTGRVISLQSFVYLANCLSAAQSSKPGVSCSPHMLILRPVPLGLIGVPLPETSLQSVASGLHPA